MTKPAKKTYPPGYRAADEALRKTDEETQAVTAYMKDETVWSLNTGSGIWTQVEAQKEGTDNTDETPKAPTETEMQASKPVDPLQSTLPPDVDAHIAELNGKVVAQEKVIEQQAEELKQTNAQLEALKGQLDDAGGEIERLRGGAKGAHEGRKPPKTADIETAAPKMAGQYPMDTGAIPTLDEINAKGHATTTPKEGE